MKFKIYKGFTFFIVILNILLCVYATIHLVNFENIIGDIILLLLIGLAINAPVATAVLGMWEIRNKLEQRQHH